MFTAKVSIEMYSPDTNGCKDDLLGFIIEP